MLLTARQILLIHFLMRLPNFVKPFIDSADRFLHRLQNGKLFPALVRIAINRHLTFAHASGTRRRRGQTVYRLPRSETKEG